MKANLANKGSSSFKGSGHVEALRPDRDINGIQAKTAARNNGCYWTSARQQSYSNNLQNEMREQTW